GRAVVAALILNRVGVDVGKCRGEGTSEGIADFGKGGTVDGGGGTRVRQRTGTKGIDDGRGVAVGDSRGRGSRIDVAGLGSGAGVAASRGGGVGRAVVAALILDRVG